MNRQFTTLLWKEWREGWRVLLVLWVIMFAVGITAGTLSQRNPLRHTGGFFLCFASALVGARLFSSEGEAGTIRFLMRQPVKPATVWSVKLLTGAIFLAALYLLWFTTKGETGPWLMHDGFGEDRVTFNPQLVWVPLVSFSIGFFLSAILDNAMLALVGGCSITMGYGVVVVSLLKLVASRVETPIGDHVYFGGIAVLAWLAGAVLFLALSRVTLSLRTARRGA